MKWLNTGSDRFTDEGVKHLANAKSLEELWLRSRSLTAKSVRPVAGLARLLHLSLSVPSIEDEDVQVLANLRRLEILALRKPALTDKQFAMFRNHPTLESAFINGNKLSKDEVVKVIGTLTKLNHLSVGSEDLQIAVKQALSGKRTSR